MREPQFAKYICPYIKKSYYYCLFIEENYTQSLVIIILFSDGSLDNVQSYGGDNNFVGLIKHAGLINALRNSFITSTPVLKEEIESIPVIVKELKNNGYGKYFLPTSDFDLATQFRYNETKYVIS